MRDFKERKAERTKFYFTFIYGWKLKLCSACNGSGWYDSLDKYGRNIKCTCCDGTGKMRYKSI